MKIVGKHTEHNRKKRERKKEQYSQNQYIYNKSFSKNQYFDYISAILGSRAPKFSRMIDYFMNFVNNLVRMRKVIYF